MSNPRPSPHPALIELAAGRPIPPVSDHDRLLASATEHRMTGLLMSALERGDLDGPARWRHEVARASLAQRAFHRQLWAVIRECQERLGAIGVEPAFVKGVVSEYRWYDAEGERPCADVDLLIGPSDVGRASEVIAALDPGYAWLALVPELVDDDQLQSVTLTIGEVDIDVHFDLLKVGPSGTHAQMIWGRCERLPDIDPPVRVLDPSTALVHFLVHLNKDRFAYLRGYVDVLRILASGSVDWDRVDELARADGLEVLVYSSLHAVHADLGISTAGLPRIPRGWRATAWKSLWGRRTRLLGYKGALNSTRRWFWIPILARSRGIAGARWWWHHLFPPQEVVDLNLPDTRGPYLWRLFTGRRQMARARRELDERLTARVPADRR